ncbi:MAG TPA: hypothetical protein VMJ10_12495 [Kofleriaceae bacterium]|nr:hypothetical protein [Kofleriaceae bacterium]
MVRRRTRPRKKRTTVYLGQGAAPAKRSSAWLVLVLGALVVVNLYVFVWDKQTGVRAIREQAESGHSPAMAIPSAPLPTVATASAAPAAKPPIPLTGVVGKSDTLGKLLKRSGLTAAEADEIIHALSGVLDFRAIRAGESYRLERGADGRVTRFELDVAKGRHVRAERKPSGELVGATDGA